MNVFYGASRTTAPDSTQFLVNSGETLGGWRKTVGGEEGGAPPG